MPGPTIFLSHSHADRELARDLADFLCKALRLPSASLRCTSAPGYKLPGGTHTETQLKREVLEAGVVVGLLSENSLESLYVAFELGARWGAGRPLVPLFAPGFQASRLSGPLVGTNGLYAADRSDLHQLVGDLARALQREAEPPNAYQRALETVLTHAELGAKGRAEEPTAEEPTEAPATATLGSEASSEAGDAFADAERVMRAHCEAKWGDDFTMLAYCLQQQREAVEALRQGCPADLPEETFARIRARAARKYPSDFTMRRYQEEQQVEAYRSTRP